MLNSNKKSLSKNVAIGIIGTIALKLISFVTVILVGYLMTKEEYGNLSTYTTWGTIFGVFIGLQLAGSLQNGLLEYGEENYNSYCATQLIVSFFSFLILFIPIICAINPLSSLLQIKPTLLYFLIPHYYGAFLVGFMSTYFLSIKKVGLNLIWSIIYAVVLSATSLLFTYLFTDKPTGYALGQLITNVSMGIVAFVLLASKGRWKLNLKYIKFAIYFSLPLIMHMLGNILLGQSDKLMIRYILGEAKMGEYSMIHNYAMLVNSLWAAINSVFLPYYYESLENGDKKAINKRCLEYYIFFGIISFGFMFVGQEIIKIVANEEYFGGLIIFPMSILSQFFVFVYSFGVNYDFYKKKTIWVAIGTISTAIINVGLNFLMIKLWGIYGAALASAISYAILIIFHELIARFVVKGYPIKFIFTLLAIPLGFLLTFACQWLEPFWYIRWTIGGIMGIILVVKLIKTRRIF